MLLLSFRFGQRWYEMRGVGNLLSFVKKIQSHMVVGTVSTKIICTKFATRIEASGDGEVFALWWHESTGKVKIARSVVLTWLLTAFLLLFTSSSLSKMILVFLKECVMGKSQRANLLKVNFSGRRVT